MENTPTLEENNINGNGDLSRPPSGKYWEVFPCDLEYQSGELVIGDLVVINGKYYFRPNPNGNGCFGLKNELPAYDI